jgi:V/A-type H+/Na+-transporting ATPase subunit I
MTMLAPEPMLEANLFVLEPDLEAVTAALARTEALHLEDVMPEGWAPSAEWTGLANRYNSLALRIGEIFGILGCQPAPARGAEESLHPVRDWRDFEAQLAPMETEVQSWHHRFEETERELEKLKLSESQVRLLLPLDMPVENLRQLQYQTATVGIMPTENVPRVAEALFQIPFILIPLQSQKDRTLLLAASSKDNAAILERALKSAFFEPIELPPEALGRPEEALATLKRRMQELRNRLEELDGERKKLASKLSPELNELWRRASANGKLAEAIRRFPKHGEAYLISGWVPKNNLSDVRKAVETAAGHPIAMEVLTADPKRQSIPSLIRAPRWLRPFEDLVTTFGLSSYNEVDPTLIVTASFLIMYGMMFGDVGHGFMLFLTGLWLRWRRLNYGILVAAAGASGILFGLLYGSAFGHPILRAAWLRPVEGMWTILITAVVGGVVLLNIGFALNLVNAWKAKDWPRLTLEKNGFVGIALYWAFLAVLALGWTLLTGAASPGLWILLKSVLWIFLVLSILLWFHEPLAKGIWGRGPGLTGEVVVTGLCEVLVTVIGYMSNSLSFIRLGAFAIAHEVLSSLVASYSSGRWGWLVLVLGTVLLVGFEGVIVGIQAIRLEYYEFFERFFQGSGKPFVPLSLQMGGSHASVGIRA